MTEPSKERIAAALALAEAVDAAARACDLDGTPPELFQRTFLARCEALAAYRATAPRLRTRAEVDAEMVSLMRDRCGRGGTLDEDQQLWIRFNELAREPTADPHEPTQPEPDPEACSCDESERLHGYMEDIKALHRVWSDNGADPFQALTCIGHVLMRWMSNEP